MVLLILAVLWGFVLIPPLLRNRAATRSESKRIRSLRKFRRRVDALTLTPSRLARRHADASRPAGAARPHVALIARTRAPEAAAPPPAATTQAQAPPVPDRRAGLLRRRRRQTALLLGAMAATAVLGAVPALRPLWTVHLLLDAVLVAYGVWLRRTQRAYLARTANVRYLPTAAPTAAAPASREIPGTLPLCRSASFS